MNIQLSIDRASDIAIYRQIGDQIRDNITAGRLMPGTRLPTVRHLAQQLGVTRLTVQNAYSELQTGGWVEATVGRGTYVSSEIEKKQPRPTVGTRLTPDAVIDDILQISQYSGLRSMASASPDPDFFPSDEFWRVLANLHPRLSEVAGYGPSQGDPALRSALAEWLRDRGINSHPDEILIVSGVTQGLALVTEALTKPGDTVAVEEPTYLGLLHTLRTRGVEAVPVPLEASGPDLDHLERVATQQRPRFFYTVPTFQNPTGVTTTEVRRAQLVALAERFGFLIVEDDIYGRLSYDEPLTPALKSIDRSDTVVHVGSVSKLLMPGLRIGYVVAPRPLHDRLVSLRRAADLCSPPLLQRSLAEFIETGQLTRHISQVLPLYRKRRDTLLASLQRYMPPRVTWTVPRGGFCCWLTVPRTGLSTTVQQAALERGWAFAPGEVFLARPHVAEHLRLCFGSVPEGLIIAGVKTLGELLSERITATNSTIKATQEWTPLV